MADQGQQVVLVRHGETEWSTSGRHTGRTDVPLTDEGRRQAKALGACLRDWRFDRVLSSPLQRATETCTLAGFGAAMEIREDLREWDYGLYEGLTTAHIRLSRPGWTLWSDGVPGGETAEDVAGRADRVIREARRASGPVVLFAHGHVLRVLAAGWLDLPAEAGRHFVLETATISVLGYERETPAIVRWNLSCG
jgi:broad specificity phosphatase PhoE